MRKKKAAETAYAVRRFGSGQFLYESPFGWRWDDTGKRTEMTREKAEEMAERLGGVVVTGPDWMPLGKRKPKRPKLPRELAPGEEPNKATRLRALVAAEDWRGALRLARTISRLGADKAVLERAWEAFVRPDFCRQLKRDPEALKRAGIEVLKRRWGRV